MGLGGVNSVVADAGPLIHLSEIGRLSFLRIFDIVHIPDAVWSETVELGRVEKDDIGRLAIARRHTLPRPQVTHFRQRRGLDDLQDGECECLFLCQQIGVSHLLTDDLAVRDEAERMGLKPVGSLGVVVRAYRLKRISMAEAKQRLMELYRVSSLFVTRTIVDLAIEQLQTPVAPSQSRTEDVESSGAG